MKWKHTFSQVDVSKALKVYAEEIFGKTGKLLLKDSDWHIHYRMGRYEFEVEITVKNPDSHFKATAKGENLYMAVDVAAEKLHKQFLKRKEQLQAHKKYDRSRQGRLERVNEMLEYDNSPYFKKPA
jgi:ribosomal subunit interface protein